MDIDEDEDTFRYEMQSKRRSDKKAPTKQETAKNVSSTIANNT